LWDALTNQAYADNALQKSMSVAQIMNTWTLQTGFPVIKVARKYSDGTATLTQVNTFKKIKPAAKKFSSSKFAESIPTGLGCGQ
jgi:aminopeptidase N